MLKFKFGRNLLKRERNSSKHYILAVPTRWGEKNYCNIITYPSFGSLQEWWRCNDALVKKEEYFQYNQTGLCVCCNLHEQVPLMQSQKGVLSQLWWNRSFFRWSSLHQIHLQNHCAKRQVNYNQTDSCITKYWN